MEDRTQPCANCRCLAIRVPHLLRKFLRGLGALWLVVLLCLPCWGEWPYDSCCVVANQMGSEAAEGSGTLVGVSDKSAIVLSCGHIFADDHMTRKEIGRVFVVFEGKKRYPAKVLSVDLNHDLSAMQIALPSGLKPVPVRAISNSKIGEKLVCAGYPEQGGFRYYSAKFQGLGAAEALLSERSYHGFSGGPCLDPDGNLVGVIIRTGEDHSVAVAGETLVKFVRRWVKD